MQFRVTVVHTPRVFRSAVLQFWIRFCGRDFVIAVLLALVTGFAWAFLDWNQWYVAAVGGISLFFIFGMLTVLVIYFARARRRLREMQDLRVEWTFDEDGLARRSERGEFAFAWSSVQKLWCFPEVWLIFLGDEDYSTLPRDAMTPLLEAFIARKVRAAGGTVK